MTEYQRLRTQSPALLTELGQRGYVALVGENHPDFDYHARFRIVARRCDVRTIVNVWSSP